MMAVWRKEEEDVARLSARRRERQTRLGNLLLCREAYNF